jgi:hypothetical protein
MMQGLRGSAAGNVWRFYRQAAVTTGEDPVRGVGALDANDRTSGAVRRRVGHSGGASHPPMPTRCSSGKVPTRRPGKMRQIGCRLAAVEFKSHMKTANHCRHRIPRARSCAYECAGPKNARLFALTH